MSKTAISTKFSRAVANADLAYRANFVRDFAVYTSNIGSGKLGLDIYLIRTALVQRAWFEVIYRYGEMAKREWPEYALEGFFESKTEVMKLHSMIGGNLNVRKHTDKWDHFRLFFHPEEDRNEAFSGSYVNPFNKQLVVHGIFLAIDWIGGKISASHSTNLMIQDIVEGLITALEDCDADEIYLRKARILLMRLRVINDVPIQYQELEAMGIVQDVWDDIYCMFDTPYDDWNAWALQVYQDYYKAIDPRDGFLSSVKPGEKCKMLELFDAVIENGSPFKTFEHWPKPGAELPEPSAMDILKKAESLLPWLEARVHSNYLRNKRARDFVVNAIDKLEAECRKCRAGASGEFDNESFESIFLRIDELRDKLLKRFE
jgi:hypothetical protein